MPRRLHLSTKMTPYINGSLTISGRIGSRHSFYIRGNITQTDIVPSYYNSVVRQDNEFIKSMQEIKLQDCGQRRRWEWEDTQVITLVVIALAIAFYTIRYPITIDVQGKVMRNDSVELLVPYKYLYLFDESIQAKVTYEGQESEARPSIYPIISSNDILVKISSSNYFLATAYIGSDSTKVKVGQKAEARIIVSDKTLWQ